MPYDKRAFADSLTRQGVTLSVAKRDPHDVMRVLAKDSPHEVVNHFTEAYAEAQGVSTEDAGRVFGKALNDLADPAWQIISGLPPWQYAGSIWRPYSALDLEKAYRAHSLVYSCIHHICTSVCEPTYQVTSTPLSAEDKPTPYPQHPVLQLLRRPNQFYNRNSVLEYWVARMLTVGRAYIWKWRKGKRINELWPIPTSWVRDVPGRGNQIIDHYEISQYMGASTAVDVEDMIRVALIDPSTMSDAVAPLQAAQHDYQLDMERQNYLVEMLSNAHVPGLKYKSPRRLSPEEKDDIRSTLQDRVGVGKRGGTLILDIPGAEIEVVETMKDLDWPGISSMAETRICAAFGVPPILVGARFGLEKGTYANYETARKSFYTETLKPLWAMLGSALTKGLLQDEGEDRLELGFDLSQITELQADMDALSARALNEWKGGLRSQEEARVMIGLGPKKASDTFCIPPGSTEAKGADETGLPATGAKPAFGAPKTSDDDDSEDDTPAPSGKFARKDARKGAISDKS